MDTVYVIAWTGGHETPQFEATTDENEARKIRDNWAKQASEDPDDGDDITLLKIVKDRFLGGCLIDVIV